MVPESPNQVMVYRVDEALAPLTDPDHWTFTLLPTSVGPLSVLSIYEEDTLIKSHYKLSRSRLGADPGMG